MIIGGAVTTVTAAAAGLSPHDWTVVAEVAAAMGVLLLLTYVLPWPRLPRCAKLVFPLSVWLALAALGVCAHGFGINFAGLFVLCYAYIGVTQPAATGVKVVPVAALSYVAANDGWSGLLIGKLVIAVFVCMVLSVLLAELVARQTQLTELLRAAAHTDALTGLPNRRDLEYRLAAAEPGDAIVFCDLDEFKALNDTFGHTAGDQVLADFGLLLRACVREGDYSARFGGEEFLLLLPATDSTDALAALGRLHNRWAVLHPTVTFSAGVAVCGRERSPAATLAVADELLYAAKSAGRNRDWAEPAPPAVGDASRVGEASGWNRAQASQR